MNKPATIVTEHLTTACHVSVFIETVTGALADTI